MWIITFVAILLVAELIAYKEDKKLADTLGITCCGCILLLYILAFFRIMSWIDYISIPIIILIIVRQASEGTIGEYFKKMLTVQNVCILITLILIAVSQVPRVATWWDDINFWATDVKALYFLDGFPGKYGNVSPEFGDYPPALSLFKWLFLHIIPGEYTEGLGFSGYMCFNFILLLPLISRLDELVYRKDIDVQDRKNVGVRVAPNEKYRYDEHKLISKYKVKISGKRVSDEEDISVTKILKELLLNVVGCFCLLMFPSIANIVCFEGTCADVTMGILYGLLLWAILGRKNEQTHFAYVRIALYGCVLVLCKTIGVLWGVFAFAFLLMCLRESKKRERYDSESLLSADLKYIISAVGAWAVTIGSWWISCLLKRRIAKLTTTGVQFAASGNFHIVENAKEKFPIFAQGLALYPMHTNNTGALDLPVLFICIIFIVALVIYMKKDIISKDSFKRLLTYIIITGVICYGVVFLGHVSIFSMETQYSTGQVMAISISRYGSPFVIGTMILLMGIWISSIERFDGGRPVAEHSVRESERSTTLKSLIIMYACFALFILLTCDYMGVYNGLKGYKASLEESKRAFEDMTDIARDFERALSASDEFKGKRCLYLVNTDNYSWVKNAYINHEVAPVAVVYNEISSEMGSEQIRQILYASHASYLYVDSFEGVADIMNPLCTEAYEEGEMYNINSDGTISKYFVTVETKIE